MPQNTYEDELGPAAGVYDNVYLILLSMTCGSHLFASSSSSSHPLSPISPSPAGAPPLLSRRRPSPSCIRPALLPFSPKGHRPLGRHRYTRASRPAPPAGAGHCPQRQRSAGVGESIASGSGSPRRPEPQMCRPVGGSYTPAAMEAPPLDLV
jgi:hypothetical protein